MKYRFLGLTAVAPAAALFLFAIFHSTPASADATIYQLQNLQFPVGTVVQIDSVAVTGVGKYGFFIQEPIPHPTYGRQWSGCWVFDNGADTFHKGDIVSVRGTYQEYFGSTEVNVVAAGSQGMVLYLGSGTVPPPVSMKINEINDAGTFAEAYEGVFIKVDRDDSTLWSYRIWYATPTRRYWTVRANSDGTGDSLSVYFENARPGDDFEYDPPDAGTQLTSIQGVLQYNWDRYRLAPRSCEEDLAGPSGAPCKPRLKGAYSTGNSTLNVQFGVDVEEATAEDPGNYELGGSGLHIWTATRDPVLQRIVHLTSDPLVNGAPEQIIVSGVRSENGLLMDPAQTCDFRSGITSIHQVQFVDTPAAQDSSSLTGEIVTVQGRITAVDGNYCYIQDGLGGPWDGIYCFIARVGTIRVGDGLQVSGAVNEYFNMTELQYRPGVDNYVVTLHDPNPVVVNVVTTEQIPYTNPLKIAERYESALIQLQNATFMDSVPGVPGPYYREWRLDQAAYGDTAFADLDGMVAAGGSYDACAGNRVNITGILGYDFSRYRIYPRTGYGNDIEELFHAPGCPTTGAEEQPAASSLQLRQNRPNPFGLQTAISFALPQASLVNLEVIDVAGRLVRVLASGPMAGGEHDYAWDGRNQEGEPVAAGTYFYRLRCDGQETARRMVLLH